ncbi:MAG: protoheme IX farnesyltransferase [Pedosphaera sp.]|nr:protoheme IX farnesyltransferase [Pedosphaera sp.]
MKTSAPTISLPANEDRSLLGIYSELVKFRLTSLVLVTAAVGFYMGSVAPMDYTKLLALLSGTALVAGAAAVFNQLLERDADAKMVRTAKRPIPSGLVRPETAFLLGTVMAIGGLAVLAKYNNRLCAGIGAITIVAYVLIYTPLKRVTRLNTIIGAVPGALPPLMGWTAAAAPEQAFSIAGWSLVAILFFWQLPHFMAISWMHREDYSRAGFAMLAVEDKSGIVTGRHALSHSIGTLAVSLCPFVFGMNGVAYLFSALILGIVYIVFAFRFSRRPTLETAKALFYCSILYLPVIFGILVLTKTKAIAG